MDTIDDFTADKAGGGVGIDDHDQYVFDDEISDYVGAEDVAEYKGLLYKYNEVDGGGKRRVQVFKYYNIIPDSHEVGTMFGGGRYLLWLSGTRQGKRFSRSFNLKLGKNYDDIMNTAKKAQNAAIAGNGHSGTGAAPVNGAHVDVMQVMNFALTLVEKISGSMPRVNQPVQLPETVLTNLYNHMQKLMFSQARDTQRMIQELRREEEPEEVEPVAQLGTSDNDFALKIIELIKSVLPTILNPLMGTVAVNAAKKTQEFKRIKDDPNLQREVMEGLKREVGPENTEKIAKSFGLVRNQRATK